MSLWDEILFKNHLSEPDGRPLFRYRLSITLSHKLNLFASENFSPLSGEQQSVLFCLWSSQRLRQSTDDMNNYLSWDHLGLSLPYKTLVTLAQQGLKLLKRPVRLASNDARLWLNTLYLEGGLPLRLIQNRYWKEICTAFEQLRNQSADQISELVDVFFSEAGDLQKLAVSLLLKGLMQIDADPELSQTPPTQWNDEALERASEYLPFELSDDWQWLSDLLSLRPRKKRILLQTGTWWIGASSTDGSVSTLRFSLELPKTLAISPEQSSLRVFLLHDGERSLLGRYGPSPKGFILESSQRPEYSLANPWMDVRITALDDNDQPTEAPVRLVDFQPPEYPVLVRVEPSGQRAWLAPKDWKLTHGTVFDAAWNYQWLLARDTDSVCFSTPEAQEIFCESQSLTTLPKLDAGKSYTGAWYRGKPVKSTQPVLSAGWSAHRLEGLVRFRYTKNNKVYRQTYEVVLPGLDVRGRIVTQAYNSSNLYISWTLALPKGWSLLQPATAQFEANTWRFTTPLRIVEGEDAGEIFEITDNEQKLSLLCFPSPQIFFLRSETAPLLEDRHLRVWSQDLKNFWWLFKTRRVKSLTLNQRSYDLENEEDLTSRPGILFLQSLKNSFRTIEQSPESDPLLRQSQLDIRISDTDVPYTSAYHDELTIVTQNFAILPSKDERTLLGSGQSVSWHTDTKTELTNPPVLTLRALWAPSLPTITLEQSEGSYFLPTGWDSYPRGMYLLTSPFEPDWMRPTLIPLETSIAPQELSPLLTISRGEVVLAKLSQLSPPASIQSVSIELYRQLFTTLTDQPDDADWSNLWLLSDEITTLGPDFLFPFQTLFEMILEGSDNGFQGFLGLCWTLRAGLKHQVDPRLVESRARRLFKQVSSPSPQPISFRMKALQAKQRVWSALVDVRDYIPQRFIDSQKNLKNLFEIIPESPFEGSVS
ncbi:MAG: hypothetical protein HKM05_02825 [Spirochaetales bacterium]|nr:hypothetical protein [Spirochaetales bacterium]